ncbi:MAG: hypothetical protein WCK31_02775 [bacterium]
MFTILASSSSVTSALSNSLNYSYGSLVSDMPISGADALGLGAFISAFTIIPIVIMIASMILGFGISFLIGYLIYKDAIKHKVENPELWGIISGITWIGILLYFVINKRDN